MRETIILQGFARLRQLWFTFGLGKPITIQAIATTQRVACEGRSAQNEMAEFKGGSKSALGRWSEGVGEHVRTRFRSSR